MAHYSTYIVAPNIKTNSTAIAQLKQGLSKAGVECHANPAINIVTAILLWVNEVPFEAIMEEVGKICLGYTKIIIVNYGNNISELFQWNLFKAGISDFIEWKDDTALITQLSAKIKRWAAIDSIIESKAIKEKMIGNSVTWRCFLRKVIEAAYFTTSNILLSGESGTGKELTAELIHITDQRKEKGELVLLDCTTIAPELSGSEFYGHEKGAFTNAIYTREGSFALAHNGTLFLDELGELPLTMQAGLLRVIQEKTYKRVGSNTWRNTNFRLVCATNKNLQKEITEGRFRQDLYFRVASAVFTLPPLSERREDIPELVRFFLRQELDVVAAPAIDQSVMNLLLNKDYPGNIRELKQLVTRIAARYSGEGCITPGDIPEEELPKQETLKVAWNNQAQSLQQAIRLAIAGGKDLSGIKNDMANLAMEIALEDCEGNLKLAARKLNVEVRTLQYIRKRNNGAAV